MNATCVSQAHTHALTQSYWYWGLPPATVHARQGVACNVIMNNLAAGTYVTSPNFDGKRRITRAAAYGRPGGSVRSA